VKERVRRVAQTAVTNGLSRLPGRGLWARWFPPARAVDPEAFQSGDEPFPRHWREPPEDLVGMGGLDRGLADLPETWRHVLEGRFRDGRAPEDIAAGLGLTVAEEQRIANRALAEVRRRLADEQGRS
jgi:DNA-directed RNA polymerase specialized sigma24 family protein